MFASTIQLEMSLAKHRKTRFCILALTTNLTTPVPVKTCNSNDIIFPVYTFVHLPDGNHVGFYPPSLVDSFGLLEAAVLPGFCLWESGLPALTGHCILKTHILLVVVHQHLHSV